MKKKQIDTFKNSEIKKDKMFTIMPASTLKKKQEDSLNYSKKSIVKFESSSKDSDKINVSDENDLYYITDNIIKSYDFLELLTIYNDNSDSNLEDIHKYIVKNKKLISKIFNDDKLRQLFVAELFLQKVSIISPKLLMFLIEIYKEHNKKITELFWIGLNNFKNIDINDRKILNKIRWTKDFPISPMYTFSCPLIIQYLVTSENINILNHVLPKFDKEELKKNFIRSLHECFFIYEELGLEFNYNYTFLSELFEENAEDLIKSNRERKENIFRDVLIYNEIKAKLCLTTNEVFYENSFFISKKKISVYENIGLFTYEFEKDKLYPFDIFKDENNRSLFVALNKSLLLRDTDKQIYPYCFEFGFVNIIKNEDFITGTRYVNQFRTGDLDHYLYRYGVKYGEKELNSFKLKIEKYQKVLIESIHNKITEEKEKKSSNTLTFTKKIDGKSIESKEEETSIEKETSVESKNISVDDDFNYKLKIVIYDHIPIIYIHGLEFVYMLEPYAIIRKNNPLVIEKNVEKKEMNDELMKITDESCNLDILNHEDDVYIYIREGKVLFKLKEFGKITSIKPLEIDFYNKFTFREYRNGEEYISFFSNSKDHHKLSNFAHIKEGIEYEGILYPSIEHAFQAQKFVKKDRVRFSINGDIGKVSTGFPLLFKEESEEKKIYWMKKDNIGILAKTASNERISKQLSLKENVDFKSTDELWIKLLLLKYSIKEFKSILLTTGDTYLLEYSRTAKRENPFWAGIIQEDTLYGQNMMGKYLMYVRDCIRKDNICLLNLEENKLVYSLLENIYENNNIKKTCNRKYIEKLIISKEKIVKEEKKSGIRLKLLKHEKRLFIFIENKKELYTLTPFGKVESLEPLVINEYTEDYPRIITKKSTQKLILKILKYNKKPFIYIEEKEEVYRLNPYGEIISLEPIQIEEYEESDDENDEEANFVIPKRGFLNKLNSCYIDSVLFSLLYRNEEFINKYILNGTLDNLNIKNKKVLDAYETNKKVITDLFKWLHDEKQEANTEKDKVCERFRKVFHKIDYSNLSVTYDKKLEVLMGETNALLIDIFDSFHIKTMIKTIRSTGKTEEDEEILLAEVKQEISPIIQVQPNYKEKDYYNQIISEKGSFKKIEDFSEKDTILMSRLFAKELIEKIRIYLEFFKTLTRISKKDKNIIEKEIDEIDEKLVEKVLIENKIINKLQEFLNLFTSKLKQTEINVIENKIRENVDIEKILSKKEQIRDRYAIELKEKIDAINYSLLDTNDDIDNRYLVLWVDRTVIKNKKLEKSKEEFEINEKIISLKGEYLNLRFIIKHIDTPKHFVCYFKNLEDELWYLYNDLNNKFSLVGNGDFEDMVEESKNDCVLLFYSY